MEPEQSLLGVVVAEDGLVGFLVARVEREVVRSLPAGLGPEAHRLTIRTHLCLQSVSVWYYWHFVEELAHHVEGRRCVYWQDVLTINVVGVDDVGGHIFKG